MTSLGESLLHNLGNFDEVMSQLGMAVTLCLQETGHCTKLFSYHMN